MSDELPDLLRRAVDQVRGDPPPADAADRVRHQAGKLGQRPPRRRWLPLSAAAAVVLVGAAALYFYKPPDSWAQYQQELQKKPWIHGVAKNAAGGTDEIWFSPSRSIMAAKHHGYLIYDDIRRRVTERYDPAVKELVRVPLTDHDLQEAAAFQAVLAGIQREKTELVSPLPDWKVVDQHKTAVTANGVRWEAHELVLSLKPEGAPEIRLRWTFRIDPKNRLPAEMRIEPLDPAAKGQVMTYTLDYPGEGPKDVYALGLAKDVKLVDRIPTGDLARIVAGVKAGRAALDGSHAVVFEWISVGDEKERKRRDDEWYRTFRVSRVWRKGDRMRVELGMLADGKKMPTKPAEGEDLVAWWMKQRALYVFMPAWLCDGKQVYQPGTAPDGSPSPNLRPGKTIMPGAAIDEALRSGVRHHLVEGYAFPDTLSPSELFDTEAIEKPKDGPPGCVLLSFKARRELGANAYTTTRYWIDPKRGHVVRQSQMELKPPGGPSDIDYRLDDLKQSPTGAWYPTVVRWKNSVGVGKERGDQCRRYILDFPTVWPEELFKPTASK
jgi:hypothetical protein